MPWPTKGRRNRYHCTLERPSFLQFYVSKTSDIGLNTASGGKIRRIVSAFFNFCNCMVKGRILFSRSFIFFVLFCRKTKTSIDRWLFNGNQAFSCVEFQFSTRVTRAPGARHAGPLHMSPVTGLARLPGRILWCVHMGNFSPVDRPGWIQETQPKWWNINFYCSRLS